MNKATITTLLVIIILVVAGLFVFNGDSQNQPANTSTTTQSGATTTENINNLSSELATGSYAVDTEQSTVQWTAYKTLVDGYKDVGEFPVSAGKVTIDNQRQISATTTLDIAGLNVTSVWSGTGADRLASHLRSEDFFDAEQFPTSTLTTTAITQATTSSTTYNVTADLTMKGQTNQITFPATIGMQDDAVRVQADTQIDRSRWNIRYGSPSFFNDLGDDQIGDMVDISVDLVAEMGGDQVGTTTDEQN